MNRMANRIKVDAYRRWLQKNSATRLLALEAGWLSDIVADFRGLQLAYAGVDQAPQFLKYSRCQHNFRMAFPWQNGEVEAQLRSKDDAWPLPDESLDVVVLQHALDLSRRPHQLIREAARSLVSNGYLVVVGFNPVGWWGVARWLQMLSTELPWIANPVSCPRLQDWLTLLDFRTESVEHIAHVWPLTLLSERLSRRADRLLVNKRWLPGNGYILVARKTIASTTRIREKRWLSQPGGFVMPAPAVRQANRIQGR